MGASALAIQKTAVVVVSHYNAWPTDQLVHLLDQIRAVPAGHPFTIRVVVNQAEARGLKLPDRFADVEVFHRENTGYNIGAWEYGWRQGVPADYYLFLQEECSILRRNWLRAYLRKVDQPGVGVVGESIAYYNSTWDDIKAREAGVPPGELTTQAYLDWLERWQINKGIMAEHLQSLVVSMSRRVLEAVGGFRIGLSKIEAIAAEIAISKSVEVAGYRAAQVSLRPFSYIFHPQWREERDCSLQWAWVARRIASQHLGLAKWQRLRRERQRQQHRWPAALGAGMQPS